MAGKEKTKLPKGLLENLEPGEVIIEAVKQRFAIEKPKWVIVTNRRVIVFDEKLLGRYELTAVPYEKLEKVVYHRGLVGSSFKLILEDGSELDLSWLSKDNADKALNAIKEALERISVEPPKLVKKKGLTATDIVLEKPKELVTRGISRIEAPPGPQEDPLKKLEELKRLLDQGAITREEYEKLKARILAQLQ